jgi:hypothetical protein
MRALVVVEPKVAAQAAAGFARGGIFGEVDLLVFHAAPQALGENVVAVAATAIHADLHIGAQHEVGVLRAGEMTPLVAVPNLGPSLGQCRLSAVQDKGQFERVGQLPSDHVAAEPIQHRHQIDPAGPQSNVGDTCTCAGASVSIPQM